MARGRGRGNPEPTERVLRRQGGASDPDGANLPVRTRKPNKKRRRTDRSPSPHSCRFEPVHTAKMSTFSGASLGLDKFSGEFTSEEKCNEFITKYDVWCSINRIDKDADRIRSMSVFLGGPAKFWYKVHLANNVKFNQTNPADNTKWEKVRTDFLTQYTQDDEVRIQKLMEKLWTRKKAPHETYEAYYFQMVDLIRKFDPTMVDVEKVKHIKRGIDKRMAMRWDESIDTPDKALKLFKEQDKIDVLYNPSGLDKVEINKIEVQPKQCPDVAKLTKQIGDLKSNYGQLMSFLRMDQNKKVARRDNSSNSSVSTGWKSQPNFQKKYNGNNSGWNQKKPPPKKFNKNPQSRTIDGIIKCFSCGTPGHYQSQCERNKAKNGFRPTSMSLVRR